MTRQTAELMQKYSGDRKPMKKTRKAPAKVGTPLHSSIVPGSVLIILSGRFRGKRVVYLKELPSGLLLITGPHSVNGVPIRRVSRAYVIVTSTKIDVSNVDVSKFDDTYFKKDKATSKKDAKFFPEAKEKKTIKPERIADQLRIDGAIKAEIAKTENLSAFLGSRFSLTQGGFPHCTRF